MRVEDLFRIDIGSLTQEQLNKVAGFAQSQANRSLRSWIPKEHRSPSARQALKYTGGGLFNIKEAGTLNQQKKELARAIAYLQNPTSTQKGWRSTKYAIIREINKNMPPGAKKLTYAKFDDMFDAYEKAKELNKNISDREYKYNVIDTLLDEVEDENKDIDEIAVETAENFADIIEKRERETAAAYEGISSFFR